MVTRHSAQRWVFKFLEAFDFPLRQVVPIRDLTGRLVSFDHQGQTPFLSHHHAPITTPLHLSDTTFQCMWLQPPLLSPEQAFSLSIHRMKATLLAAAGQLDLNRDKVTAKKTKKSVPLYARDDVWPLAKFFPTT